MTELPNGFTGMPRSPRNAFASRSYMGTSSQQSYAPSASDYAFNAAQHLTFPAPLGSYARGADVYPTAAFSERELAELTGTKRRHAWIEIDLSALRNNVREVRKRVNSNVHILAVVKADAYGHGAVEVAREALKAGASFLAVATVEEGIQLRDAHITAPILMLSQPPTSAIDLLLAYHIIPSIYEVPFALAYGECADAHGVEAPYHLAVNSGMNRIGVRYDEVGAFLMQVNFHRALKLEGIFTHFATADEPEVFDFEIQVRRFEEALAHVFQMGIDPGIVHAANSAAALRFPKVHYHMVRWGIGMYGHAPFPQAYEYANLKPVMSVHARITAVKTVPMSEGVSYGFNYRSPGSVKICTIPFGYADGLVRALSGKIDFLLNGKRVAQVGNICMDQCMFEVNMRSFASRMRLEPQVGDEVVIIGTQGEGSIALHEHTKILNTIPYELLIGFSKRAYRIFT